ncbi:Monocarboxylate transporter 14 [Armadillidium vulgare]|nr:Monocarboxylate transporter 14 [Armadillidium vulgare]
MSNLELRSVTCNDSPSKLSEKEEEQPPEANDNSSAKAVEMVPPDGGWGWIIVVGSFWIICLGTFPLNAFSIILSPILMSGQVSSTKIAWIFNLYQLIWSFYAIFIGPLCEQFGSRKVAILGGIASFLSLFLSAFVPTADYLFFTFALPGGIGGASTFALTFMVVSTYFKKHRGFAIGITSVGGCVGTFISPLISNALLQSYGYIGATVICAAITLNQCVGSCLYQPVKWHMKPAKSFSVSEKDSKNPVKWKKEAEKTDLLEKYDTKKCKTQTSNKINENKNDADKVTFQRNKKSTNKIMNLLRSTYNNLKSLKYLRVHFIACSFFGLMFGFTNFYMWIPFVITSNGCTLELAAWCASLSSIGNITGRILMALLADRKFFNVIYGFMFGQFLMGISIIAFSLVKDITYFMIVTSCFGFGFGIAMSSYITVMIKVMGIKMLPAVLGVSSLFKSIAGIIVGPLIGVVHDATKSFTYSLWILGGLEFIGVFALLLLPLGGKFDNWNMRRMERKENHKMDKSFSDI